METDELNIKIRKGETFDTRYYVEVDGEQLGWISKRVPLDWDEDRTTNWIPFATYEKQTQGIKINEGERTRRSAIHSLLSYRNAGTDEQRWAWYDKELHKAYGR